MNNSDFTPEEIMGDAEAGLLVAGFLPVKTGLEDKYIEEAWQEFGEEYAQEIADKIRTGKLTLGDFYNYLREALTAGYLHGYTNGKDAE